ncbi:MAG TPA: hypothetical protein VFC68_02330 [Treponemataceae bacterium]|nr:hypothetical protein [Treponemataceae bacterium]
MKKKQLIQRLVIISILFFAVSCGGAEKLSGEYICTKYFTESGVGELSLEFTKKGEVRMRPTKIKGTYTIEGEDVILYVNGVEIIYAIKGNDLVSSDDSVVYSKQ